MSEKIKGIVIRSNDRKEKDKNILLFSLENGKVWATLKGVKGNGAKMKVAQNLFCFGDFLLEDGKAGKIVTGVDVIESFHELSEDIDKYFEGMAILEVLNAIEIAKEERPKLFVLVLKALKSLCFENNSSLYVLDKFLIELFKINGCPLYTNKCSVCGDDKFDRVFIDFSTGEIECISCKALLSEEIAKGIYHALKILNETDFSKLKTIKLAKMVELSLLKLLVKNFESRFDKKLKLMGILS